jgi:ABC-2 type transport system ATP-binding protein
MSGEPALRCSGLGKRYGRRGWALRDCDLELPQGGVIALAAASLAAAVWLVRRRITD